MKNLKSKKLYLQVFEEVKNYIVKYNFKPGDKLPTEMEMAEKLGVSRNVLREALKTLEIIGVVSSKPGVGMTLNSFNSNFLSSVIFLNLISDGVDLIAQTQEVRKVLELGFSRQCFDTITDKQIETLDECLVKMKNETDSVELYAIDSEFHRTLYKNINNDVLVGFIDATWNCEKYYHEKWEKDHIRTYNKHAKIVEALKGKNYEDFQSIMQYHFAYEFKIESQK